MNIMASYWHWNLFCLLCAVFVAWLAPTTTAVMEYCSKGSLKCTLKNATKYMILEASIPELPDFPCFKNCTANLTCCEQETTTEVPATTVEETTTESATTESTTPTSTDTTTETTETTTVLASSKETSTESALTPPTSGDDSTTPDSTTLSDIDGPFKITSSTGKLTSSNTPTTANNPTPEITGAGTISATLSSAGSTADGHTTDLTLSTHSSPPMSSSASDHSLAFTEASSSIALTSPVYNTTTQEISNYTTGENTTTPKPKPPKRENQPLSALLIVVIVIASLIGIFLILVVCYCCLKHFKPSSKVGPEQDVPLSATTAPAENGIELTEKRPLSSPPTGQQLILTPHKPDEHTIENESGRDRSVSTGSQAGDTIVLIKPQVVPEVKRTKRRKKRGSRGVTELKPLRTRQQSYDFHAAENGTE
ncbi:cell wall protein DAN4-like isoform X2 [Asterias rubens]|uniref:cell wall protein DAN4-like isoform X2 n=1 Tax=Asterias rubens TaxID=7604 RepID=UPI00145563CD|nr:cell wall protein DAN4-like isoform X2 [Asterias rubens]